LSVVEGGASACKTKVRVIGMALKGTKGKGTRCEETYVYVLGFGWPMRQLTLVAFLSPYVKGTKGL
jgi:hypothetical protein